MKTRFLFVSACFLFLSLAGPALADGKYQRTKDGRILVWNNRPAPGDAASWTGGRDSDGYATGYGTLTWYTTGQKKILTGSSIPSVKHTETSRYSGVMVHGKLEGAVVNVDANGKTFHGTFADGAKGADWKPGTAAVLAATEQRKEPAQRNVVLAKPENAAPAPAENLDGIGPAVAGRSEGEAVTSKLKPSVIEPPAPAEGPRPTPIQVAPPSQKVVTSKPATPEIATPEVDDSLDAIISASSLSRMERSDTPTPAPAPPRPAPAKSTSTSMSTSTPPAHPVAPSQRLTTEEVSELADAEARARGYKLNDYARSPAQYSAADDSWSISYEQRSADGMAGKQFSVRVESKTKKASIEADR